MLPDIAATADERSREAQGLIDDAQGAPFVELVTLSALDLCTLGGPRYALFEEPVAQAWLQLDAKRRSKIMKQVTDGLVERRLLAPGTPGPDGVSYSLSPALGIALAARCRPAFIVVTETASPGLRTPRLYALGDQEEPLRAVVVEEPAALPAGPGFPNVKKLGPLGRFYRYVLVSRARAAEVLAEWAMAPPPHSPAAPGADAAPARAVSVYHHDAGQDTVGTRLGIRGDGTTAHLLSPEDTGRAYDHAGLAAVMLDLMTRPPR
jgi:hypothetical protein